VVGGAAVVDDVGVDVEVDDAADAVVVVVPRRRALVSDSRPPESVLHPMPITATRPIASAAPQRRPATGSGSHLDAVPRG
jgi:hypothetical protein